jgi:hypothetical protein
VLRRGKIQTNWDSLVHAGVEAREDKMVEGRDKALSLLQTLLKSMESKSY